MSRIKKIIYKTENGLDRIKFRVKDLLELFDPVIIYPYRGFGNQHEAFLHGRILEKEPLIHESNELEENLWTNLRKAWDRYESDEIPGATVQGRLNDIEATATSDKEGYFTLHFKLNNEQSLDNGWHKVALTLVDLPFDVDYERETYGEVLIADQSCDFGIISDVDDTIIKSNIMHPWKKVITMLKNDAESRIAFEGVPELYQKMVKGNKNPLLFVSGSSYNLYDMLTRFCEHHDLPKAPFFLRDLGLDNKQWIKQDTHPYKFSHIEHILKVYPELSFICIGDSGQEDPEIYRDIHLKHPGRIMAIYIRHVHTDERLHQLKIIQKSLDIPMLIMKDSSDALDHAAGMNWI
jgi:phosphatidate phosphatase APP1